MKQVDSIGIEELEGMASRMYGSLVKDVAVRAELRRIIGGAVHA